MAFQSFIWSDGTTTEGSGSSDLNAWPMQNQGSDCILDTTATVSPVHVYVLGAKALVLRFQFTVTFGLCWVSRSWSRMIGGSK
jgi:hypothetical protein